MEKLYYYDDKIFTIKELEEYTRMKKLWIYKELIEKDKVKVIENMSEIINMYDMLVFEDESGSIYQDCVCNIEHCKNGDVYKLNGAIYKENKFVEDLLIFEFVFDSFAMNYTFRENKNNTYRLKEIWTRTDEDTYKKVWESK